MQVYCRKTNGNAELHCCVCGQGFVMFWDRQTLIERAVTRAEIQEMLRRQHRATTGPVAHPLQEFSVPDWQNQFSADLEAMAGSAPVWDL